MKDRIISIIILQAVLIVAVLSFCACGSVTKEADPNVYMIYYTNQAANDIIYKEQKIEGAEGMEQYQLIETLLNLMFTQDEEDTTYYTVKPENVELNGIKVDSGLVTLDFNAAYSQMTNVQEILFRASVVSTICQIPGVKEIAFTIEGNPLTDSHGSNIGSMSKDTFVNVLLTEEGMLKQEADLTVYFANQNRTKLAPAIYRFTIDNSNSSMEEYIMNRIMTGPEEEDLVRTIAPDVQLNNVATTDHVCYVNFGPGFLEQEQQVSDELMIYAIVDSLCQLPSVYSVRFLIDGEPAGLLHGTMDLSEPFTPDQSYIQ